MPRHQTIEQQQAMRRRRLYRSLLRWDARRAEPEDDEPSESDLKRQEAYLDNLAADEAEERAMRNERP